MPHSSAQSMPEGPGFTPVSLRNALPLANVTVLAVEDSRFASEALRLLCQRSGARLRRVETMAAARRHLAVYRPDVVLVDLGLPDGSGLDLIRDITRPGALDAVVLAISGDPGLWSAAVRAGAAGFLEKPLETLEGFQQVLLSHLKGQPRSPLPQGLSPIRPDRQALHDDLVHAASVLEAGALGTRRYIADFVQGIARSCHDSDLQGAAAAAATSAAAKEGLSRLLAQRISGTPDPFVQAATKKG
ncbi:response regulator [Pseudorhodobacter sp. E13]|uniref:response regulator n=1 Tax=Pseudorhodobacter sp. E13 TaxID=2487931 RepID=UPI000F8CBF7A|nr:response regulator [Pseudorhodobacter sp. E13]RUS60705.1 response regulator [Pseudorhodobacter sp. E13]